jgi:predicted amidohydrolase YtcJ
MGFDPKSHNGILNGEDHEFNVGKMDQIIMKSLSVSTLCKGVQHLINDAIDHGIVGIHCLDGLKETNDLSLWFLSKFAPTLPLYLRLFPQLLNMTEVEKYSKLMQYKRVGGCYQWEMDGSIGSQTASFFESFATDPQNFGRLLYPYETVLAKVREAYKLGYQIISHAIGTKGIDNILNAFDTVLTENNDLTNKHRLRIEHFEFPTLEQVDRAVDRCHLLFTAQPGYSWMDETFQKAYRKYLRPEQFNRQIPMRTIVEKGGIICGSSDSPVQTIDPFTQLHGMVNFPLQKEQLSVYQALRCYTYNGAYSTFEESFRGTLKVGKWADFIVLTEDPFHMAKERIIDLKVEKTILQGRLAHKMNSSTTGFLIKGLFAKKRQI